MSPAQANSIQVPQRASISAMAAALIIVVIVGVGLRLGTHITHIPPTFDEPYITVPIINLLEQGWSVRTAIDFDETKGPGLIWAYALAGEAMGSSLNAMRLTSVLFFLIGALPLLDIARRCGIAGLGMVMVGVLYALLPYHAMLGQLVMSESSFVAFAIVACWLFVWGVETEGGARRVMAPVLFAIVLSILLHNRVHAAAIAPALCLVAWQRGGMKAALPWAIACALAALSRVPLLVHWGGIVSPRFQGLHATGFRFSGVTYLLASLTPVLLMFIPEAWSSAKAGARRLILAGAMLGLAFSLIAMPQLNETISDGEITAGMFSGIIATGVRMISPQPLVHSLTLGLLAIVGGAGLSALAAITLRRPIENTTGVVNRLQFWIIASGVAMYLASAAPVYDRYVLAWTILLPVVWQAELSRWRLAVQTIVLAGVSGYLCWRWLM